MLSGVTRVLALVVDNAGNLLEEIGRHFHRDTAPGRDQVAEQVLGLAHGAGGCGH